MNNIKSKMKKLLLFAAMSVMGAMSAVASTYTLSLSGAKAVYVLSDSLYEENGNRDWTSGIWENLAKAFLDKNCGVFAGSTWEEKAAYARNSSWLANGYTFTGANGSFSIDYSGNYPNQAKYWSLMVLTDATEISPGAAFSVYYATSGEEGGPITIQGSPIASGIMMTDSGTPTVDGYTLNLSGAKAVYVLTGSESSESSTWAQGVWGMLESAFLDKTTAKQTFGAETWTEVYAKIKSAFNGRKFAESNGNFSFNDYVVTTDNEPIEEIQSWALMVLTDATEISPGAAYSIYYGTSDLKGGAITIQGSPIASGKLMTDSGTPTVDGYTLNIPGAKAVYALSGSKSSEGSTWAQGLWQDMMESTFLDETTAKQAFSGETWTEVYDHAESALGSSGKFTGSNGSFSFNGSVFSMSSGEHIEEIQSWVLMVLTDATKFSPGAAYSVYYGTSDLKGGPITIQGSPIASGNLKTDTPISADPSVTIDKVATVEPWDSKKGEITVDYSLGGIDSKYEYKVAFDVTAGGKTASITNAAAKLTAGKQPQQTINTVELFGKETVDKEAKLKISLIVVKPKESAPVQGGVQLWANGPFWAESNLGSADDVTHPEYGLLYTHDAAVNALPSGWRLPTKDELAALLDESKCSKQQTSQNGVEGCLFTSKSDPSKSVFMPYGGTGGNNGTTRNYCTIRGVYWSSTGDETPWTLGISPYGDGMVNANFATSGQLVRPVRDAE